MTVSSAGANEERNTVNITLFACFFTLMGEIYDQFRIFDYATDKNADFVH